MKNFYFPVLQFLCLLSLVSGQGSSISFSPDSSLCIGEEVEMICFVESSVQFGEDDAQVSINSSVPFPISQLVSNATVDGIDLSRYSANFDGLSISLSRPGIRLIINSYQPSDSATVFGCHGEFMDFTVSPVLVSGQPNPSAAPPSAPSLQSSVSNFNTTTCSADISLSWNTPPSNRAVDRYFLYLDGYPLATTNSDSYIHSTILNINTDYQYSVTAMSCAGNSTASSSNVNSVATPPSAPSLQSSVSNFNTATCSADISLSWNNLPSNRTVDRYFLYLDGSPLATVNSNSYIHSTILKINTDYQYSVTAMNCAGNSTTSSSNVNSVASYSLMKCFQSTCLDYNNTITGEFTVNWTLSTSTQPSGLDITYSLQLLYSHSRQGVTYTYTDSTSFTLPSSQLSYNTVLTAHNFTQLDGVETNITANLTIVQQCGQSSNRAAMECFFNSNNPPTIPTTTTPPTTSISRNTTFSTLTSTTANTTNTTLSITIIIIGSTVGGVSFVVILSTPTFLFVLLVIFLSKKKKNEEHTGTDGSGVKNYKELGEDTYSQVNKKPPKHKPEPVKKDQCELNYLEIDHSSGTGKIVKPPIIPKTNYADINSFPQETQYASLQN